MDLLYRIPRSRSWDVYSRDVKSRSPSSTSRGSRRQSDLGRALSLSPSLPGRVVSSSVLST